MMWRRYELDRAPWQTFASATRPNATGALRGRGPGEGKVALPRNLEVRAGNDLVRKKVKARTIQLRERCLA
jgi:hypothetical protein